jgi:DNA-binding GntR family transcriptional regulator
MQFSEDAVAEMVAQGMTDAQIEALRKRYTAADEQAAKDDAEPKPGMTAAEAARWRDKFLAPVT